MRPSVSRGRLWPWLALGLCLAAPARSSGDSVPEPGAGSPALESFRADAEAARSDPSYFFDGERGASADPGLAVPAGPPATARSFSYLDSIRPGGPLCCAEEPSASAFTETVQNKDSRFGPVLDAAPAAVESVSILSTTMSAAELSVATFGVLGAVLGPLAAGLVAVGVAQAGYELYRKYKEGN